MTVTKLGSFALRLARKSVFLQRFPSNGTKALARFQSTKSVTSSKNNDDDDDMDRPIKFSGSEAESWNPEYSRTGADGEDWPWYQSYVVCGSTAVFLIYFCILREENDIDKKLTMDLADHFEGQRKANLIASQKLSQELAEKRLAMRKQ